MDCDSRTDRADLCAATRMAGMADRRPALSVERTLMLTPGALCGFDNHRCLRSASTYRTFGMGVSYPGCGVLWGPGLMTGILDDLSHASLAGPIAEGLRFRP
jgi:hypothetical protein